MTVFDPFGQILPSASFLPAQGGVRDPRRVTLTAGNTSMLNRGMRLPVTGRTCHPMQVIAYRRWGWFVGVTEGGGQDA
jgi:hypothetical protein